MNRRRNVQHGQRRRMPWRYRVPIAILTVEIGILAWLLLICLQGVSPR